MVFFQLNLWGFERIKQGPNKGGYFHPLFIKGKKQLCNSITRIKVKNPGAKSAPTSVPVETGSQPPVDASAERRMPLLSSPVSVEDSSRLYRSLASGYPASGLGSAMQSLGNPPSLFSRDFMPPFSDDLLMSHMALQSEVARLRAIHARAVLADHEAKHARATLELMVSLEEAGKRPVHGSLDDRLEFQALRRSSWHFFDQPRETPSLKQRRESLSSLNAQLKTIQKRRALLGLVSRLRDKKKLRH